MPDAPSAGRWSGIGVDIAVKPLLSPPQSRNAESRRCETTSTGLRPRCPPSSASWGRTRCFVRRWEGEGAARRGGAPTALTTSLHFLLSEIFLVFMSEIWSKPASVPMATGGSVPSHPEGNLAPHVVLNCLEGSHDSPINLHRTNHPPPSWS